MPQPGPQQALIDCPCDEIFFGGQRGGAKTNGSLGHFSILGGMYPGYKGWFFRRTYKELKEAIDQSYEFYPHLGARWRETDKEWIFPNRSKLRMCQLERDTDAHKYQGQQVQWLCVDDVSVFPSLAPIELLKGSVRSAKGYPRKIILTGNPGGPSHNALKRKYIDPSPPFVPWKEDVKDPLTGKMLPIWKVFIPSKLSDNKILCDKDPFYAANIMNSEIPDWLKKAWLEGDWDIVAGGMFDDIWDRNIHVVPYFEPPKSWTIDRNFDWGSSKPYANLWVAQSDGTKAPNDKYYARGSLFVVRELYGCVPGKENVGLKEDAVEVALKIQKYEGEYFGSRTIMPGAADSSIYAYENGACIGDDMAAVGVRFFPADRKPGSRIPGWHRIRQMLSNAVKDPNGLPGLYIMDVCRETIRTFPMAPRCTKNIDDLDTEYEDHICDVIRYRANSYSRKPGRLKIGGL